jgi:hypothetical protein
MAAHVHQQAGRRQPAAVAPDGNLLIEDAGRKEGNDNC